MPFERTRRAPCGHGVWVPLPAYNNQTLVSTCEATCFCSDLRPYIQSFNIIICFKNEWPIQWDLVIILKAGSQFHPAYSNIWLVGGSLKGLHVSLLCLIQGTAPYLSYISYLTFLQQQNPTQPNLYYLHLVLNLYLNEYYQFFFLTVVFFNYYLDPHDWQLIYKFILVLFRCFCMFLGFRLEIHH